MKEHTMSLTMARQALKHLTEQFSEECPALTITRAGEPVLTITPYQHYQTLLQEIESLRTMLEIMCSHEVTIAAKPQRVLDVAKLGTSWEDFQKEVGWE